MFRLLGNLERRVKQRLKVNWRLISGVGFSKIMVNGGTKGFYEPSRPEPQIAVYHPSAIEMDGTQRDRKVPF